MGLSWGSSFDAGGIAHYNVHRSTTAGFTPSTANRIGQPTATTYTDVGVPVGTYYYKVTAEDPAGNVSAASNEAQAVVQAPPPIAAYGFDVGQRNERRRPVGQRQQRHAHERDLVDERQVRQGALLQRHERLGHRFPTRARST